MVSEPANSVSSGPAMLQVGRRTRLARKMSVTTPSPDGRGAGGVGQEGFVVAAQVVPVHDAEQQQRHRRGAYGVEQVRVEGEGLGLASMASIASASSAVRSAPETIIQLQTRTNAAS